MDPTEKELEELARFMWEAFALHTTNGDYSALTEEERARLRANALEGLQAKRYLNIAALALIRRLAQGGTYAPSQALALSPLAVALVKTRASAQQAAVAFERESALRLEQLQQVRLYGLPLMIVSKSPPNALVLTSEEEDLFEEAIDHLPDALLEKLRAFLRPPVAS